MTDLLYISDNADQNESRMELLKTQVHSLSIDDAVGLLNDLEGNWQLNRREDATIPFKIGFEQFFREDEIDVKGFPKTVDIERVATQYKRQLGLLGELYHRTVALGIFDDESLDINNVDVKVSARINRLIDMADDAYETVFRYTRQYERINHPTYTPINPESDHSLFRCSTMDLDDTSQYQQLLLALLNETYVNNIRRYKGQCCKQIMTIDQEYTKAWKPIMPIADFVYTIAQKETRFLVWKNLTAKASSARDAIKHLSDCKDMQFPDIIKNRNVWSFKNGLFVGKLFDPKSGKYTCKFYKYDSKDFRCLDPLIVSAKFFDAQFDDFSHIEDWYDIRTPHFQQVLDYQKFDEDVARWMYVMGGRLCFDVGDMDGWQIIPFLKGIARSGKSTLITKVFKKFYENDDVRTLSNNIERKFGLSSIYDGFMFIAPEVKGDLCLEQAEFQSLVSGEDVSIAVKHEKAKSVEWKTPGILGGNEVPNWRDNSGSVLRRLLPWNFSKQVKEADTQLDEKLDAEMPIILLKCVRAYLEYSQKHAGVDIWNVVPAYFKQVQTQVAMVTNTLQNFLASEKVQYAEDLFVPQKIFVQIFNQHCQENNLGKVKFNPDFYAGPFSTRDIEVRNEARTYKGRAYAKQPFVFGIDVVEDTLQFSDDY
jgi:hypothetical protein